ncbi:MAG TPA: helix-turn-helix domain-containing protein [Gaiellaceae bacterium]|nr:helix-turn-helix domain-containing protein [Gaiellaceae bacterium]
MLLIDTASVPARERLEYWSDSAFQAYLPVQIRTPDREEFDARMWGYELGPVSLFRISAAPNTMIRTSRAIAACDPECLHLSVVLRGRINAAQEGRTGVARTGDMISYETSHPVIFRADQPYESLVVRVPKQLLGREATRIGNRTAVGISGNEGLPRAAVAFFRSLVGGLEDGTLTAAEAPNAVDCVLDLVRGLYAPPSAVPEPTRLRTRAEILLHIQSFIEANLGDPGLTPEEVARASFISTRYLHKLFEGEGTSVCRWIKAARLERCRRDLLDPALVHEPVLTIATRWGLPSPQHFSRLFRSAYGCSPSELRRDGSAGHRRLG